MFVWFGTVLLSLILLPNAIGATDRFEMPRCEIESAKQVPFAFQLNKAIADGDEECVVKLLKAGADPNEAPENRLLGAPIVIASNGGKVGIVKSLISFGLNINGKAAQTGLMISTAEGHLEIVDTLLNAGIDVDGVGEDGSTAIMAAAARNREAILDLLLKFSANVNAKTKASQTPLMFAGDNPKLIKKLVDSKAEVNSIDNLGRSAVSYAIDNLSLLKLRTLLENGATLELRDQEGLTPLMRAKRIADPKKREEVVSILKQFGTQ